MQTHMHLFVFQYIEKQNFVSRNYIFICLLYQNEMCLTDVCTEFINIFMWYTGMFELGWFAKGRQSQDKRGGQVTCNTE